MTSTIWTVRPRALPTPMFARSRAFLDMAERTTDLITVLDAAGRQLYANPAFVRQVARAGHFSGSDPFGHIHPEERSRARKLFMRLVTGQRGLRVRHRIVERGGRVRRVESHAHVVRDDRGALRILVVAWECAPSARAVNQEDPQLRAA